MPHGWNLVPVPWVLLASFVSSAPLDLPGKTLAEGLSHHVCHATATSMEPVTKRQVIFGMFE